MKPAPHRSYNRDAIRKVNARRSIINDILDSDSPPPGTESILATALSFQPAVPLTTNRPDNQLPPAVQAFLQVQDPDPVGIIENLRCRADLELACAIQERHEISYFLEHESSSSLMAVGEVTSLCPATSPAICALLDTARERLGIESPVRISVRRSSELAASIYTQAGETIITLTSAVIRDLSPDELLFVLGHELGQVFSADAALHRLASTAQPGEHSLLPASTEPLLLRWRRVSELSADRCGLVACRNLDAARRAICAMQTGLPSDHFCPDRETLMARLSDDAPHGSTSTHPPLPVRILALEYFAESETAMRLEVGHNETIAKPDALIESDVDGLLAFTRRHPVEAEEKALMEAVFLGGIRVLSSDGHPGDDERRLLTDILYRDFTDEPDSLWTLLPDADSVLRSCLSHIHDACTETEKCFVVSRIAEIALIDGHLRNPEIHTILDLAARMGLPPRSANAQILSTCTTHGFGPQQR